MFDPEDDISLANLAGLDISLASDKTIHFAESIMVDEAIARPLHMLTAVALEPSSCIPADRNQYWLYNGVARRRDRERISTTGLRYSLTLLLPNAIGRERSKTLGHRHNQPAISTLDTPEVYEVISGSANFFFQTLDEESKSSSFCAYLQAKPGDKVIIPPNLYHLLINAGSEPLVLANVLPVGVKTIRQPLASMHGAAWLNTTNEGWIKNPRYQSVAELTEWQPVPYPDMKLTPDQPLYQTLIQSPELLLWLLAPMSFPDMVPDVWDSIVHVMGTV